MTDAPERIHICPEDKDREWSTPDYHPHMGPWVEYIRADLACPAPQPVGVKGVLSEVAGKIKDAWNDIGDYLEEEGGTLPLETAREALQEALSTLDPQPARTFTEDEALAMVAGAWRDALKLMRDCGITGDADNDPLSVMVAMRAPEDATEALARVTDAARREALEGALNARGMWFGFNSSGEPDGSYCTVKAHDPGDMRLYINAGAIRALIDKT